MHFITRERIHVERIATAWAMRRFIDSEATFQFVAWAKDVSPLPGIPFDLRGAELGHRGGRCTLEALIDKYELSDEPLRRLARIIRDVALPNEDPTPAAAAGVLGIFDGLRDGSATDEERLERGFMVCDALYAYCRANREAASE